MLMARRNIGVMAYQWLSAAVKAIETNMAAAVGSAARRHQWRK
jgi:hypothetical protein